MGLRSGDLNSPEDRQLLVIAFFIGMIVLVADYVALAWVGLWLGLSSKNSKTASSGTVSRILILPWLILIIAMSLMRLITRPMSIGLSSNTVWLVLLLSWFFLSLAIDWLFGRWAYRKLHQDFRTVAMQRFQPISAKRWWWPL
jgi:hypothetical protein